MMDWARNESSIGTTGRDFTTVAAWEAAVDPSASDDSMEVGTMFADSIFTEVGTVLTGATVDDHSHLMLRANDAQAYNGKEGDGVVMAPASGTSQGLNVSSQFAVISGIEIDGGQGHSGSSNGLFSSSNVGNIMYVGCCAHDNQNGAGFRGFNARMNCYYSNSYDNLGANGHGYAAQGTGIHNRLWCCGAYNNAGSGLQGGGAANTVFVWGCWSLANTGASVVAAPWTSKDQSGFCIVDDTVFTDNSHTLYGIVESFVEANANFTNIAARDFRISASGSLQGAGPMKPPGLEATIQEAAIFGGYYSRDGAGRFIEFAAGDRFDVGPDQLSLAQTTLAIPSVPTIAKVSTTATTIVISFVGDAGITHEAFFRLPGGAITSGGTRVGDGNITISGLVTPNVYEIWGQSKNADGAFGQASFPLFITPAVSADTPSNVVAALIEKVRATLAASANLLAWIQTINGAETTSGHVIMGMDPRRVRESFLQDNGPMALINWNDTSMNRTGSAKVHTSNIFLDVEFIWFEEQSESPDLRIEEANFLGKLLEELAALGTPLDETFGGVLNDINGPAFQTDPGNEYIKRATFTLTANFGNNPAA